MSQIFELPRNKDPYEKWFAEIDISQWLGGETIQNVDFTAKLEDGTDATSTMLDAYKCTFGPATGLIKPYIQGGVDGERYIIIMKVTTATDPSKDIFALIVPVQNLIG